MMKSTMERMMWKYACVWMCTLLLLLTVPAMAGNVNQAQLQSLRSWKAGTVVSLSTVKAYGMKRCFGAERISDQVFQRMQGKSYHDNPNITRDSLRYIRTLHYDLQGRIHIGEMVCNRRIAAEVADIFRQLFAAKYPIERMVLIDNYNAVDEESMRANNSSSFCYRVVHGSTHLSAHALGMAVDINTLYNPYIKVKPDTTIVQPSNALKYCNRSAKFPYKIVEGDLCYRLFVSHGFEWGGAWHTLKDYQHFEKK
jgi:hypothetical protein